MSIVAENARKIIKEKGLKQCAVAKMAGYKQKEFNNLLTGRKVIRDTDIWNISKVLEVTPNVLFSIK